jgi:hypothetical protein
MRTPDFLLIGAQKSGSTWLTRLLGGHRDIFMPVDKDPLFFSVADNDAPGPFRDYLARFADAGAEQLIGDACSSLFWTVTGSPWDRKPAGYQPQIPAVVRRRLGPKLKLVLILRDPVERALSAYAHLVAHGELAADTPFTDALNFAGVVEMGLYAQHLGNWLAHYPAKRIHVMILEQDVRNDPLAALLSLQDFLSVDRRNPPAELLEKALLRGSRRLRDARGRIHFEPPAHDPERRVPLRPVPAEDIRQLRAVYRDDVLQLERLLGRRLRDAWNLG